MRLEWIEDLLAVIDTGSLSRAAQQRFLSQSAFTRRVRSIEHALGVELIDRTTRPVRLLAHVQEQENAMRRAVVRLNALKNALSDSSEASRNRVSFVCQHTIATTLSPGLIRELTRSEGVNVRVKSSNRADCLMMLLAAESDFALIFETPEASAGQEKSAFLEHYLGTDQLIPVMATEFRQELSEAIDAGVLPMVAYPREVYLGQLFEHAFLPRTASVYQIRRTAETGLTLAALHYTLEGIGIGWLPRSIAARDLAQGKLLELSDQLPVQDLRIKALRSRNSISAVAEQVWTRIAIEYDRFHNASTDNHALPVTLKHR